MAASTRPRINLEAALQEAKAAKRVRLEKYPDESACLLELREVHQRLIELGWKTMRPMPSADIEFDVIEAGCTSVKRGGLIGGRVFVADGNDWWPCDPMLWRERK